MEIRTATELERALHEFQSLEKATAGSPGAKRRDDLAAAIDAYYVKHRDDVEKGKPEAGDFARPVKDHPGETE